MSGESVRTFSSIAFIGGGQMAEALIKGIVEKGIIPKDAIRCSEPLEARRNYLASTYGIALFSDNCEAVKGVEAVLIAVKPQIIPLVLRDLSEQVTEDQVVISIAAGITLDILQDGLPSGTRVIRVMPNTPALIQEGAAALCKGQYARDEDMERAMAVFGAVGIAVEVHESLMDAVTGLSGSGPAYCFMFIESLIEAGIREGLPRQIAQELAIQTVIGSALMCRKTGRHPDELMAMVTSPGGTTIQGIYRLHKGAMPAAVMDAVHAATRRSRELGGKK